MATTEGESVMGYIEVYNIDKDGEWTDLNDIPFITTINCQLCNEPTEAHDIIIPAIITDGNLVAGTWQCKKCHAVNG
jgi:hypothetical protein